MEINNEQIAELVTKVQNGDGNAFNKLYELTNQRAYFVALEFVKNDSDAEDILQDSYIKALQKITELDKPESFQGWLNRIVANKCKDFIKKKKPMLFEAEENEVFEVIPDEDTSFAPEENLDQTELQRTVLEILDELSEEKRACIMMTYYEEMSVSEVAQTLEIPVGTVKTRLFSARKDLKEKFSRRGITSLYSLCPIGVVLWALRRSSVTAHAAFAASAAPAKILAGINASAAGVAAGTVTAAGTAGAAASAAATGTGIAAKIAALTVVQKAVAGISIAAVVAGSGAGIATVAKNTVPEVQTSTTAYVEETTTAAYAGSTLIYEEQDITEDPSQPDGNGTADAFLQITGSSTRQESSVNTTQRNPAASTSATKAQTTSAKVTATANTTSTTQKTTVTTTKKPTTTKATTTTTKVTTTAKAETTTAATTQNTKPITEPKPPKTTTTTKATTTTTKPTTTTTTKATTTTTTTTTTTEPETQETTQGTATVMVDIIDLDGSTVETLDFSVPAGTVLSKSTIRSMVESNGYSITAVFGSDAGSTAEADKTYTFEAEI